MRWIKSIFLISIQNFRKWRNDYRVWIAFLVMIIMVHSITRSLSEICSYTAIKVTPWIYPFLYMGYYNKLLLFFPLLLIFSNAPFFDRNQLYVLARSGKKIWCLGQVLYIVLVTALYFLLMFAVSIILNLNCIELSGDWGKVLNTLAVTDLGRRYNLGFNVEKNIITYFSPIGAIWFTFLHSWFSGVILGLIMFYFNMKTKGVGTFVSSFVLVLSGAAAKRTTLVKISPISWSTLNYIHLKENDLLPSYFYITTFYIILLVVLFGMILHAIKKFNFDKEIKQ